MSVVTISSFALLLFFTPLIAAFAEPCPECEAMGMTMPAVRPAPVTVTEPCCECGECEMTSTPQVLTRTVSTCTRTSRSVLAYTSGSTTYLMSSCVAKTSTLYTTEAGVTMYQNETCAPSSSISTATVFRTGLPAPPSTVTITARNSTSCGYNSLVSPIQNSPVSTVTFTTYVASGSPPATGKLACP